MIRRPGRAAAAAAGGSVLAAAISSACCWLPLVLIVAGASAVGVSAVFDRFRPLFLALSVLLLGVGFYLNYFRRQPCRDGDSCATGDRRLRRFSRTMLWMAAVGVVVFAFFPSYVGALLGNSSSADITPHHTVTLLVDGMTCDGCAITVEQSLLRVPGVTAASVSYDSGHAVVVLDPESSVLDSVLIDAVEEAGYEAALIKKRE